MASHHHLRHRPSTVSYCCCCPPYSPCHYHPPPPPPPDCHRFSHQPPQSHLFSAQTHLPDSHHYRTRLRERYFDEEREAQDTIASLLLRIAALESALRGRSSSSSSYSLRDAAARTIQTHFRAFLLRRSRTLRQLKDLAFIKSALGVLKSSVAKQILLDYDSIYHQAMELALRLDTVQGVDPMIRDGKILVKRELNKFMDFIHGLYVERVSSSTGVNSRSDRIDSKTRVPNGERKTSNVKSGGVKSVAREEVRGLVERIEESEVLQSHDIFMKNHNVSGSKIANLAQKLHGVRPKVKKNVSFADEGKVYSLLRRNFNPFLDEDDNVDGDDDDYADSVNSMSRDFKDGNVSREVEENGASWKVGDAEEDEVEAHSGKRR